MISDGNKLVLVICQLQCTYHKNTQNKYNIHSIYVRKSIASVSNVQRIQTQNNKKQIMTKHIQIMSQNARVDVKRNKSKTMHDGQKMA